MKKKTHERTKEREGEKMKKMFKNRNRNNINCVSRNHRSLNYISNNKYKCSDGRKWNY